MDDTASTLIQLTADIVSTHVSNNKTNSSELPALISGVFAALSNADAPAVPDASPQEPAVSIRASVKPDYIVCLEDGAKLKMLKRYLSSRYNMTPDEYRAKWNLPRDYPMVAPAYAEQRRTLAHAIGLGRKKTADIADIVAPATRAKPSVAEAAGEAQRKRGRPRKVAAPVDGEVDNAED